jgi:hypothetical protein
MGSGPTPQTEQNASMVLVDELNDGGNGYLIERALDEARARQFTPFIPPS